MAEENAKGKSQTNFNLLHTKLISVRLNLRTDADILEHLEQIDESVMGYIKRLIREDMSKQK